MFFIASEKTTQWAILNIIHSAQKIRNVSCSPRWFLLQPLAHHHHPWSPLNKYCQFEVKLKIFHIFKKTSFISWSSVSWIQYHLSFFSFRFLFFAYLLCVQKLLLHQNLLNKQKLYEEILCKASSICKTIEAIDHMHSSSALWMHISLPRFLNKILSIGMSRIDCESPLQTVYTSILDEWLQ